MCYLQILQNTYTQINTHTHTCPYVLYTRLKQASRNLHKMCHI